MTRIRNVQICFTCLFILLGVFLYYLQIIKGSLYTNLSYRNSIRLLNIPASRGVIYDRYNRPVVTNSLSFRIFVVPQEMQDIYAEFEKLSKILGVSQSLLERNYKRSYIAPFAPIELLKGVSKKSAILVEESKLDMPGILVREIPVRDYIHKDIFSHLIGYIGEIDERELSMLKPYGYNIKDLIGKDGVERFCDSSLRGKNGGMQIQVDNMGRQVRIISFKKPIRGKDVFLTLDIRLQRLVWNLMRGEKGAAIFMDLNNGEILGLVSSPSYDPNDISDMVLKDKDAPFLNRAISGQYAPGSVFKLLIALAGLEAKRIRPETSFVCMGKLDVGKDEFSCWDRDGHGVMDLRNAIIQSCNVYFYNTGLLLGMDKMYEYASQFGFGRKTGIELFGERAGFIPSRTWKRIEKKENWYAGDTANFAIGQGYLLVTPLQIICLVSSIANGGYFVEPHILRKIGNADISVHKPIKLKVRNEDLEIIKEAMRGVVEDKMGTGIRAWSDIVSIAGKTGTVQIGQGLSPHGWFVGFAPSQNPKISFVVFLENSGSGGDMPAEIAKKAVEYWWSMRGE